jgi:hypothetical protein
MTAKDRELAGIQVLLFFKDRFESDLGENIGCIGTAEIQLRKTRTLRSRAQIQDLLSGVSQSVHDNEIMAPLYGLNPMHRSFNVFFRQLALLPFQSKKHSSRLLFRTISYMSRQK